MIDNFIFFLEELKENYSSKLLKDTFEYFRNEFDILNYNLNDESLKNAINNQDISFYNELAFNFVDDLNNNFIMYTHFWEELLGYLNEEESIYFYKTALELSKNSNATFFIKGIKKLEDGNPEIALSYFNYIDDYFASYFIAKCYLETENYENSIKQYKYFIKTLNQIISDIKQINFNEISSVKLLKWNVYNDLGFCYNRLYEFQNAVESYENSFNILKLDDFFQVGNKYYEVNGKTDLFSILANNFLLALERTNQYERCLEILEDLIYKYPNDIYYKNKRDQLIANKEKFDDYNYIFTEIYKPKKPYNIGIFESIKLISKEKSLEDLIVEQIKYGITVFGKPLEIYQDEFIYGRQYRIPEINGILDLLLIDKSTNQLYLVELKRNEAGIEVIAQIEKYIQALSKQLNKKINGIICLHKPNSQLIEMVKSKESIELFKYTFDFERLD